MTQVPMATTLVRSFGRRHGAIPSVLALWVSEPLFEHARGPIQQPVTQSAHPISNQILFNRILITIESHRFPYFSDSGSDATFYFLFALASEKDSHSFLPKQKTKNYSNERRSLVG